MGAILTYKESNGANFAKINDELPDLLDRRLVNFKKGMPRAAKEQAIFDFKVLMSLAHPCINALREVYPVNGGEFYIVSDLISKMSLESAMQAGKAFTELKIFKIFTVVALALE